MTRAELDLLTAVARQRIRAGQEELDLGLPATDQTSLEVVGTPDGSAAGRNQRGVSTPSPPNNPYPKTSAPRSTGSTDEQGTNLSQLRS
jgi:hypothetical protein